MKMLSALGFTVVASLTSAQASAQSISIETSDGTVELVAAPEAVIAMDTAALDTMIALGVTPAAMTTPNYLPFLSDAVSDVAAVGSAFEPDFEAIANLGPDAVVIGARGARFADKISPIAPVLNMGVPFGNDLVSATASNIEQFGLMLGKEAEAAALVTELNAAADAAKAATADSGKALVVLVSGTELAAYGLGSRFGWMHAEFGLAEAVENLEPGRHGQAISNEFIADANPDVILVIDRGSAIGRGEGAMTVLDNPLVNGTKAAKNDKIIYLPAAEVYIGIGGYASTVASLNAFTEAFGD